jgi:epsilon-lactone hydrolase
MVPFYLGDHDPGDPLTSPLYSDMAGLPPIRVHVGDDELLLDELALRFLAERLAARCSRVVTAGGD